MAAVLPQLGMSQILASFPYPLYFSIPCTLTVAKFQFTQSDGVNNQTSIDVKAKD